MRVTRDSECSCGVRQVEIPQDSEIQGCSICSNCNCFVCRDTIRKNKRFKSLIDEQAAEIKAQEAIIDEQAEAIEAKDEILEEFVLASPDCCWRKCWGCGKIQTFDEWCKICNKKGDTK